MTLRETPCGTPTLTAAPRTLCLEIFLSAPYSTTVPKKPALQDAECGRQCPRPSSPPPDGQLPFENRDWAPSCQALPSGADSWLMLELLMEQLQDTQGGSPAEQQGYPSLGHGAAKPSPCSRSVQGHHEQRRWQVTPFCLGLCEPIPPAPLRPSSESEASSLARLGLT